MQLQLTKPDDWHLHLRDGEALNAVAHYSAKQFGRALIMPNLTPPVTDVAAALAYRERILAALPAQSRFEPKMALYLTDNTPVTTVAEASNAEHVLSFKLYPAGATTNSAAGVTAIEKVYPLLEAMEKHDIVLCIHGEIADPGTDIFDREHRFVAETLAPLIERFAGLRVVLEHITTKEAADFVTQAPERVAATITPQHLLYNRNAMLTGGIRPHFYCLPIIKRETHRLALGEVIKSGNPRFFLGTDSAPHAQGAKESACGCAGIFSAPAAIELYALAFERFDALDKLNAFAGHNGADFYRLPRNTDTVTLNKTPWQVPASLPYGDTQIIPLCAGETLAWKLA